MNPFSVALWILILLCKIQVFIIYSYSLIYKLSNGEKKCCHAKVLSNLIFIIQYMILNLLNLNYFLAALQAINIIIT